MALTPGTCLGRYEVTALIGEGGMGQVWRARDKKLDGRGLSLARHDARPRRRPEDPARVVRSDADRLMRFEREAKALGSASECAFIPKKVVHAI
jgi:serine/threonine protein kinase